MCGAQLGAFPPSLLLLGGRQVPGRGQVLATLPHIPGKPELPALQPEATAFTCQLGPTGRCGKQCTFKRALTGTCQPANGRSLARKEAAVMEPATSGRGPAWTQAAPQQ